MPHTLTLENGTSVAIAPLMLDMGGTPVDFFTLPEASMIGYAKRGNRVVFGNEASSEVNRQIRKYLANGDADAKVETAAITAWRDDEANVAKLDEFESSAAASYRDKVLAGELGQGRAGTGGASALEKMQTAAIKAVLVYAMSKLSPPMAWPTGKGAAEKGDELIDSLWHNNEAVRTKFAKRYDRELNAIKAERAARAASKAQPVASVSDIASALGNIAA